MCVCVCVCVYIYMHVCTYTHPYLHIYFTACGPPNISALCMGGGTRCSGRVSVPCFTSDTCHKL